MTPFVTGVRRSGERRGTIAREEGRRGGKRGVRWRARQYYCWLKFFVAWVDLPRAPTDCTISLRFLRGSAPTAGFFLTDSRESSRSPILPLSGRDRSSGRFPVSLKFQHLPCTTLHPLKQTLIHPYIHLYHLYNRSLADLCNYSESVRLDVRSCRFVIHEQLLIYYSASTTRRNIISRGIGTFKNDKLYRNTCVRNQRNHRVSDTRLSRPSSVALA